MKNCITFPVRQSSDALFYTTNIVLSPIVFGLGTMGNLLAVIVFSHGTLRKDNPLYVYLGAIATVHVFTLLLLIPSSIQDMEMFPPEVTYSKLMVYVTTYSHGLTQMLRQVATWILVFAVLVRYTNVRRLFEKPRWTRISASRIIVFVVFLFCMMVNFPRFFAVAVTEVEGHCFKDVTLWHFNYTDLGTHHVFATVYPWVVVSVGYAVPFSLIFIMAAMLLARVRISRLKATTLALHTPKDVDDNEVQISGMLLVVVAVFFALEIPDAACHLWFAIAGPTLRRTMEFYHFQLIAHFLGTLHCCVNFGIYILFSSDFRKICRRTFCCLCNAADEYTEPITCASVCCCSRRESSDDSGSSSASRSSIVASLYKKFSKEDVKKKEHSPWI